jgi:hypothetical protein
LLLQFVLAAAPVAAAVDAALVIPSTLFTAPEEFEVTLWAQSPLRESRARVPTRAELT